MRPIDDANKESIRITFRQVGEERALWPTGVGEGVFVPQGTLDIAGESAQRVLLVCPNGEVTEIWYYAGESQPLIRRDNLEFGVLFNAFGHCEPGYNLGGEAQQLGETIISSLKVR